MATKAERKAQARAERQAREHAAAVAAARRKRLLRLGGVLLLAAIAVVVAIVVSSGGSGSKKTKTTAAPAAVTAVDSLLASIPQSGNTLGPASAPVTVTIFEDLQCPVCRDFTLGPEARLIANEVRTGRAKLVFRALQTATPDAPTFRAQQEAAAAAGLQGKYWHFTELFFHQQGQEGTGYVTESFLDKIAKQVRGLDYQGWIAARKTGRVAGQVSSDEAFARAKGFASTPTVVVQGPKSSPAPVEGLADYQTLSRLITQAGG